MSSEIHSILFFGKEFYFSKCKLVYSCLKVLTVLDLSLVKYLHGMPSGITDLIHLRYLALRTIGSLYKFRLLKLQNLQTLIVCSWMEEYPLQLACDILDLPQLRHLHLEKRCSQYLPSVVRENLQTLYWLKVTSLERKPDFRMAPNLKELGIYIEGELLPGYVESLVHLHLLEKLKFEIGRVEQFYLPNAFPSNLKKLTFHHTYLPWEKMGVIGKLQKLEVLKLKDFAFHGSKWEPKDGEFGVLKVPYCFAKIGTMKLIVLDSCTSSLVASTNLFSSTNMLLFMKMPNEALRIRCVGTKVELPNNESSESQGPCAQMACSDVPIGEFMRSSPNRGDRKVLKAILQCNRGDRKVLKALKRNALRLSELKVELPNNESSESQGPCAQMACSDVPIGEFMRSSPNRGDRKVLKAILQCNRGDRKVLKALKRNALRLSELKRKREESDREGGYSIAMQYWYKRARD
nr:putative late blight resistance protein homolog R1B-17 [Ipomoea batatas]